MPKYQVQVQVIERGVVTVEAESRREAELKVDRLWEEEFEGQEPGNLLSELCPQSMEILNVRALEPESDLFKRNRDLFIALSQLKASVEFGRGAKEALERADKTLAGELSGDFMPGTEHEPDPTAN